MGVLKNKGKIIMQRRQFTLLALGLSAAPALFAAPPNKKKYVVAFAQDTMANDWRAAQVRDLLEATRRIRMLPGRREVPILAMTANAFAEDRLRCIDASMDDFITKPVNPEDLFETVLKCLRRKRPSNTSLDH